MSNTEQPREVTAYLRQLDVALADVQASTADEIRQGITEELASLSPAEARQRIGQLGDPSFIAAQARQGTDELVNTDGTHNMAPMTGLRSRAYVFLASAAVAIGGWIAPVAGWIVGYVLVLISPAWRRWEKITAVAAPIAAVLLVAAYFVVLELQGRAATISSIDEPVFPLPVTATWNALIALVVTNLATGIWLLIRAIRRM